MQNFVFTNPTTIVFGKGQEGQVGALCSELGSRVLILHYGGTFLQDIGLYDGMMASFKEAGLFTMELGGVVKMCIRDRCCSLQRPPAGKSPPHIPI